MRTRLGVLVAGSVLLLAAGCGSDRPSVDDMARSFENGKAGAAFGIPAGLLRDAQYQCIAKAIVDSELSDDAVRALEQAEKDYAFTPSETEEIKVVGTAIQACKDA